MRKYVTLVIVVAVLVIIDQVTKYWAVTSMSPGSIISITSFFNLTLVYNTGGAFGFLSQVDEVVRMAVFVAAVIVIIVCMVYFFAHYYRKSFWASLCISMIIGGAMGNLIDRVRLRKVVDFLDLHAADYHWPAFNFADICVTVGIALFIIYILFEGVSRKH